MKSKLQSPAALLGVLFLMASLSACGPPSKAIPTAQRIDLPDLPLALAQRCEDPGIGSDALKALLEHRVALATCRRRHADMLQFYLDTKGAFEHGPNAAGPI